MKRAPMIAPDGKFDDRIDGFQGGNEGPSPVRENGTLKWNHHIMFFTFYDVVSEFKTNLIIDNIHGFCSCSIYHHQYLQILH